MVLGQAGLLGDLVQVERLIVALVHKLAGSPESCAQIVVRLYRPLTRHREPDFTAGLGIAKVKRRGWHGRRLYGPVESIRESARVWKYSVIFAGCSVTIGAYGTPISDVRG
jgi:hypothetical protein